MRWRVRHAAIAELATLITTLSGYIRDARALQEERGPSASRMQQKKTIEAFEQDLVFLGATLSFLVLNDTTSVRRRLNTLSDESRILARTLCPILYAEMTREP